MTYGDNWEPVTAIGSQGDVTWQVWCDPSRPPLAEQIWPDAEDFLATMVEINGPDGAQAFSGFGGPVEPGERLRHWHGRTDGLPRFVMVRFAADIEEVWIETTRRAIQVVGEDLSVHFGRRFAAFPLHDDEELITVADERIRHWHPEIPRSGAGFIPALP